MDLRDLGAPAMVTWQLTRDCNLACLHCCTDSAPGRALDGELPRDEALRLARRIAAAGVPKVMLCGGEPTIVPHFLELAETLGEAGVYLKIETNGQNFGRETAERLADMPIFSIQVSLDGDTRKTYVRQRPRGNLDAAHRACRAAAEAGLPLEITFAPTRINIAEAEAVVDRAASFGAFRFNTGLLMRLGTAAKLWDRLVPSRADCARFLMMLRRKERELRGRMELCFRPWSIARELRAQLRHPPATLLVLPDGRVKVGAALPFLCADLKRQTLPEAWQSYCRAWTSPAVARAVEDLLENPESLSRANDWTPLDEPEGAAAGTRSACAPEAPGAGDDRSAVRSDARKRLRRTAAIHDLSPRSRDRGRAMARPRVSAAGREYDLSRGARRRFAPGAAERRKTAGR